MLEDMENFAGTYEQNSLLILDDLVSLVKQKNISEIFTKGRHHHIRIVVLAHKACDVDNNIRENVETFYTTTQNNVAFFEDIKKNYKLTLPLAKYTYVKYGIIRVDTIMNQLQVYDKDLNVLLDTEHDFYSNSLDFDISLYAGAKNLSPHNIEEITIFLENESLEPLTIIPETFYFYFDHYLNNVLEIQTPKRLENRDALDAIRTGVNDFRDVLKSVKPLVDDTKNTLSEIKPIIKELNNM